MGEPLYLNEYNLLACLESLTIRSAWSVTAARIGASEKLMYQWLHKSKLAEKERDTSSVFWIEWRDEQNFWHRHCATARRENIRSLEALVRDECRNGMQEFVRDPSTGRRVPQLNPEFLGVSDDNMRAQFLDPVRDRWLWHCDDAGNRIEPLWEVRTTPMPASLRATVLKGLLPAFRDKAEMNVTARGAVVHVIQPPEFVSRVKQQVIDAECVEVQPKAIEAPRPDIELLRAEAARLMREGPRHGHPEGIVRDANGDPVGRVKPVNDSPDDVPLVKPEVPLREHPRAYTVPAPTPAPERPPSQYPRGTDPRGRKAMKVL